ncbi:MAG: hypothetical protein FWD13_09610 [Treponema sp.]|nr:hypothetical protein [Treponema sp.]
MKADRIVEQVALNQNRTYLVTYVKKDGTLDQFTSAKRGNKTYARRNAYKLSSYRHDLLHGTTDNSIMFVTLVVPNDVSYYGCEASWEAVSKTLGPFIRALRKFGIEKYLAVLEATEEGCCHAHILFRWNRSLQVRRQNDEYYLAEDELTKLIRDNWVKAWAKESDLQLNSHAVLIRVCPDLIEAKKVFCYITKYLGMGSIVTNAIYRVMNKKAVPSDSCKLFSNFWAYKKRIRLCRTSKSLGKGALFKRLIR